MSRRIAAVFLTILTLMAAPDQWLPTSHLQQQSLQRQSHLSSEIVGSFTTSQSLQQRQRPTGSFPGSGPTDRANTRQSRPTLQGDVFSIETGGTARTGCEEANDAIRCFDKVYRLTRNALQADITRSSLWSDGEADCARQYQGLSSRVKPDIDSVPCWIPLLEARRMIEEAWSLARQSRQGVGPDQQRALLRQHRELLLQARDGPVKRAGQCLKAETDAYQKLCLGRGNRPVPVDGGDGTEIGGRRGQGGSGGRPPGMGEGPWESKPPECSSAAEHININGRTKAQGDAELARAGFRRTGRTLNGWEEWEHSDGSKVQIRFAGTHWEYRRIPPDDYVVVYHASINDTRRIRANGLDPTKGPTWVTRDLRAAQDAISRNRYEVREGLAKDPGLVIAKIPTALFNKHFAPLERPYSGFGRNLNSTQIVLKESLHIKIFNCFIVR